MNRVYIKTYGCQMNERDSDEVAARLRERGYSIVDSEHEADIVLINTCTVRDLPEQKAFGKAGRLQKFKRKNPDFILGIIGCMAQTRKESLLDRLPDLDLIIGTQKFHRVADHLDHLIATRRGQGPKPATLVDVEEEAGSQETISSQPPVGMAGKKVSAFVSIMQGCNMNCHFCHVPQARGKERSRSIPSIIEEVQQLVASGVKEVTLLGQIVTSYGRREIDFVTQKSPFVQLLEQLEALDGLERIRFTSPHPRGFKDDLIACYGRLKKLCEHVHLPAQSFSNAVLRAMNRPYTVERYCDLVDKLRAIQPEISFSTDIIVGYPGETEEDFALTSHYFDQIGFDMAFIFKYSERPNTFAATLKDSVPEAEKQRRNQLLLDILAKHSLKHHQSLIGRTQEVLVEGPAKRGDNMLVGRTRTYRKVIFEGQPRLIGQLVPVYIDTATTTSLGGSLVVREA